MDEERRFISMLSDYGFKVTFGNEHRPLFIRKALQALISSSTPIKQVSFIKNEMSGITKDSRGGLFDMACEDELGRTFIVEMQLVNLTHFIHRAKFYAFHVYNRMVRKGNYRFDDLKPIYTVSILAGQTYSTKRYHQIGTLQNQQGELIDNQITHVIVELGKFDKSAEEATTDLDKLLYIMKLTDDTKQEAKLPDFWREGWLEEALHELVPSALSN
jgi:predicted transposase/invertase (TIGR01784 family)